MRSQFITLVLVAVAFFLLNVGAARANEPFYSVVPLGSLGGTNSGAISINNRDWISGYSFLAGNTTQNATLWLYGKTKSLGTLGGPNSSIAWPNHNSSGLLVGYAETAALNPYNEPFSCIFFTGHVCRGFVWYANTMTALPTLGGYDSYATDINDWGQIVGWAEDSYKDPTCVSPQVLQFEAVIWQPWGQVQELRPYPGDSDTAATAINNSDEVVGISGACDVAYGGTSAKHAVIWQYGKVINLPTLGGMMFNTPSAVNQAGFVTGWSDLPGDTSPATQVFHAVVWTRSGKLIDLGTLPGDKYSLAYAINDWGQVVGQSIDASGNSRAFLWQDGVMVDLNTLVNSGSPDLVYANDINDAGRIVGGAFDSSTNTALGFEAIPNFGFSNGRVPHMMLQPHNGHEFILPEGVRRRFLVRGIFGRMDSFARLR